MSEAVPGRNLRVCARKPRACQTVGRHLKIQIRRTMEEALSARLDIGSWQPTSRGGGKKGMRRCRRRRFREASAHYGCQPPVARPRNSQGVARSGICLLGYSPRPASFDRNYGPLRLRG